MSHNLSQLSLDYRRIEEALQFIEENFHCQPSLQEIAANVHVSEYHFQRLFSRWVGISPKRFLAYLTVISERTKCGVLRFASCSAASPSSAVVIASVQAPRSAA